MARLAVLCVLFACLAVAVYGQTCESLPALSYANTLSSGDVVVDATQVVGIAGGVALSYGTGGITVDYQKNQGWKTVATPGNVVVTRTPINAGSVSGMNMLVTFALAVLALVSQRGSLAALAIVLTIATVALASCATPSTLDIKVEVDQSVLHKLTLKVKASTDKSCPPTGFTITTSDKRLDSAITKTLSGTDCIIEYLDNTYFGCDNTCGSSTVNVQSAKCESKVCQLTCAAGFGDCDTIAGTGCEADLSKDSDCGACKNDCAAVLNVSPASVCEVSGSSYACSAPACAAGWSDCNKDMKDGCEAQTDNDANNCGGCGTKCADLPGVDPAAAWTCANSVCSAPNACLAGKLDCSVVTNDGCEADASSTKTCGFCDVDCTLGANYDAVACNGTCSYTCKTNFDDCDTAAGCETDVSSDVKRCGSCTTDCTSYAFVDPTNANTTCSNGKCSIGCVTGYADCDGVVENGCETKVDDDVANCGACKAACSALPNLGGLTCAAGVCQGTCDAGFDQCDNALSKSVVGCPDDVASSTTNCGTCGNNCPLVANAAKKCTSGVCGVQSCNANYGNCDAQDNNGCEVALLTTVKNCGTCGTDCSTKVLNADAQCAAGKCTYGTCAGTFQDCNADKTDGCEIDTGSSKNQCGGCTGQNAGGYSVDCTTVVKNVNTVVCLNSACDYTGGCTGVFKDCDAKKFNGCEIDTGSDVTNCGGCSATNSKLNCKTLPNVNTASITCSAGKCATSAAGACLTGFNDCNGVVDDGCELPTSICDKGTTGCSKAMKYTTPFDCATLDASKNVDAGATCSTTTGLCAYKCSTGFSDCDGDITNGCETQTKNCGSDLTTGACQTAQNDVKGHVSCLALATDALLNVTVQQTAGLNVCDNANGLCKYTCAANYFDCDGSAINGCEIDTRKCPTATTAECVFDKDTRCGYGECVNCLTLSGTTPGSAKCVVNGTDHSCTLNGCNATLCKDLDGDWKNGCESAQGYIGANLGAIDCSKDIDLTHVLSTGPILCVGDSSKENAGRCDFVCATGWMDCDGSPLNGCETNMQGKCDSCVFMADVQCGKNKCVDCTLLEGTLLSDYANGRFASASASTCLPYNFSVDKRVTDYYCDTSVHYLNPRFDAPNGHNGACQSELCRDLDDNWENGCESAQGYGRGRFYYYGDEFNTDAYLVPYVPNPYQARFYEYKTEVLKKNAQNNYVNNIINDIKAFSSVMMTVFSMASPQFTNFTAQYEWDNVIGHISGADGYFSYTDPTYGSSVPSDNFIDPNVHLSSREVVLLHYTTDSPLDIVSPADAAALVLIPEPYLMPQDCELSEWSDWGICTYEDDCIVFDYFRQTKIRTREVVKQATGGGVCHLPIVEDFYRFAHRQGNQGNWIEYNVDTGFESVLQNFGTDFQHGGGLGYRVDYTGKSYTGNVHQIQDILLWNPFQWNVTGTWSNGYLYNGASDARALAWTGNEYRNQSDGNETQRDNAYQYARLLTCAPKGTCPPTNTIPKRACNITAWSEWSQCTAACDGDWAGGVRIRTRTVIEGAAAFGECFSTEFDEDTGEALVDNAGMLYEEDWQCNDHSCSSYDCTQLRNPTFAEDNHIYLGADGIEPQCDGRDWSEYVNGAAFIDFNRDGGDDNSLYEVGKLDPYQGNFPLFWTIFNFSYDYRWPGHCLYECEEGWFDCDHDPRNGCETNGDFCSIDAEFDSLTQLTHPILPWEHPHGECTVSWDNSTIYRDCTDYNNQDAALLFTTGLCNYWSKSNASLYGKCDLTCEDGFVNCFGDGCIPVVPLAASIAQTELEYCGSKCIDCEQLNRFQYGSSSLWTCSENEAGNDYFCKSTGCTTNCHDLDGDYYNGCETADYVQLPYPEVEPFDVVYSSWSTWTPCSHADQCGYLWDLNSGVGVFRNVPIQTRYRVPVKSAYNGGFYDEFSYVGKDAISIDGMTFPIVADFDSETGRLGLTPPLSEILGVPLVQTPFYEVKVCSTLPAPCIECTNQLEGLEVHCVLSDWSKWSACSAECVDRIADPVKYDNDNLVDPKLDEFDPMDYSLTDYWVVDRQPYQIRTRTVSSPARRGGRCPPPGDTWQVAEANSHVSLHYSNAANYDNYAAGDLIDNYASNALMSAKASYLVDIRKCNSDLCEYPEDCDALNYYFPGHFKSIVTCVEDSNSYGGSSLRSRCGNNDRYSVNGNKFYCNEMNGYCSDNNDDLRDGCETYVYPTACGRTDGDHDSCDYAEFRDCTTLPGVVSPFAAPCVNEFDPEVYYNGVSDNTHYHVCDIRWACDSRLCTNELYHTSAAETWKDGCEVARYYQYPFVTVDSAFEYDPTPAEYGVKGNPISLFYDFVIALNTSSSRADVEWNTNWLTFTDNLTLYTLNASTNSKLFNIDCSGLLYYEGEETITNVNGAVDVYYCASEGAIEPEYKQGTTYGYPKGKPAGSYALNAGCHLIGDDWENEYYDLGFGCNGVWGTPTAGMCVQKCADGYVDADLDPRNGCETDTFEKATPEDRYVWVGDCVAPVTITSPSSCGADLCIDCRNLPGLNIPRGTIGSQTPNCTLVEEWIGRIPVLNENDYFSIQYACGVATGSPAYQGEVDFRNTYCPTSRLCFDADGDWTNGCEQGRGYARGSNGKYTMGAAYDDLFDYINFFEEDLEWPTDRLIIENTSDTNPLRCDLNFINTTNGAGYYWYNSSSSVCDPRSSGFEFPVPGASFFRDLRGIDAALDPHGLAESSRPVLELSEWLDDMADLNGILAIVNNPAVYPILPLVETLNTRAFDCSLPYSTELLYLYDANGIGYYVGYDANGVGRGLFTFGQVFHVNTSAYVNGTSGVCNIADGFCQYVCASGWDDFDLDPSNGCEADLSGPCGQVLKKYPLLKKGTYQSVNSCGADCVDCENLPGAYNLPSPQSQCFAAHPKRFHYNQEKADYVIDTSRFVYTCSTESVQSDKNHTATAWQFVICDPRKCFDANFEYQDGCELATNYPETWSRSNFSKSAYKHWFSPIAESDGSHHAETTYWVREDGLLAIGRAPATQAIDDAVNWPTALPDNWAPVFDFLDVSNTWSTGNDLNNFTDLDGEDNFVSNFWFQRWNVTEDAPGYIEYKWQVSTDGGYDTFPFKGAKSAYDCSNAYVASGVTKVFINSTYFIPVEWTFTPKHKGPWFHVNQSAVQQCTAGYDPSATQVEFQNKGNVIMSNYCTQTSTSVNPNQPNEPDLKCYSTWKFKGEGRCKLTCENGWADGDGDPTNGCETFLNNSYPYPASQCGANYKLATGEIRDPALSDYDVNVINYNFNQQGSCGAGVCLACTTLGGVSALATRTTYNLTADPTGMKPFCLDGGDSWVAADTNDDALGQPVPVLVGGLSTAVGYPGDYYCTGIINMNACRRLKIGYSCASLANRALCPEGFRYPHVTAGQYELIKANASYIRVCEDRDGLWENGCEYALGYNLDINTNQTIYYNVSSNSGWLYLLGQYKRTVGVKPFWDGNFTVIDWGELAEAGFDCEIIRLLPRVHTHVTPETATTNKIECAASGNAGEGTCSFTCDNGWNDCDANPWNGCEQSKLLCGGTAATGNAGCQTAQMYSTRLACTTLSAVELARSTFCDGNQIPFDDWTAYYDDYFTYPATLTPPYPVAGNYNADDARYFADQFEITDHGLWEVDAKYNYVNPTVSRYTIKGYWDNVDIDYSCRIWVDIDSATFKLRALNTIPADANRADGKCAVDCNEAGGYSDCDGVDVNGCDQHNLQTQCRSVSGDCISCINLPGTVTPTISQCLSVDKTTAKNYGKLTYNWDVGFEGIDSIYSFTYGLVNPISSEFPQCDTRSELQLASGYSCDSSYCRDYDQDWENGCEFPMGYGSRAEWETQQATYGTTGVVYDGFDCSWISDPQPDAGGRNYGGKTWAQKFHVNLSVADGSCIGDPLDTNAGKCNIVCEDNWSDCDGDPSNGCENDERLCGSCVLAKGYPGTVTTVNCSTLVDTAKGFVAFTKLPKCNGREGEDGQCSYYFCNIFDGYCDSGLSHILAGQGCINLTASADAEYCGADWNWRDIRNNESTVSYYHNMEDGAYSLQPDYLAGRMLDYSNFDGTGRCATCTDLNGYESNALCQYDPVIAGHTYDRITYYKPGASGWIDNGLGYVEFDVAGNTVGDYLCQLHGEMGVDDDGECDRRYCVDEDYFWANGCETAVRYSLDDILYYGTSGDFRDDDNSYDSEFGFDYHFAYNDDVFGTVWPYSQVLAADGRTAVNPGQVSSSVHSNIRGIWCPFLQFWSLATDNFLTGDCDVFPCPHFAPTTVDTWITCVSNTTLENAGLCNFVCNVEAGWKDCDANPMTGCETDIFNDGTCGSECQRVECNSVDGLNPWYWSECVATTNTDGTTTSKCDLSICNATLCKDLDGDWTNGCETAMNYQGEGPFNCRDLDLTALHFANVSSCNGEAGNHWAGKCEFKCAPGWIDCNGLFADGCEHDGSLCQDCKLALGYVTYFDGADWWEFWGPAVHSVSKGDYFYKVVYGSRFDQSSTDVNDYDLVIDPFQNDLADNLDQFDGPQVPYAKYGRAYVAAFDCTTLTSTYPGHFKASTPIKCDSDINSASAGLCTYECDDTAGYFDCDGDPRNGCEHQSLHEACGVAGACRNCYYLSGVDYPVDQNGDDINDGSMGPYANGAFGNLTSDGSVPITTPGVRDYSDVYHERNVTYFSRNTAVPAYSSLLNKDYPDPATSPLRLGCILNAGVYACNLDTCVVAGDSRCQDKDQGTLGASGSWLNGCEQAQAYDFDGDGKNDTFDCSLMGPDPAKGDAPRNTTNYKLPSYHIRQRVGTVGCDSQDIRTGVANTSYVGKGAWRYVLSRAYLGRTDDETEGDYAFDFEGLDNYFNDTVLDFPLYRVRGSDRAGTCYYECEYGFEDCNGDPRDGCEVDLSACVNGPTSKIGWDWVTKKASDGCEMALGYTIQELALGEDYNGPVWFDCERLRTDLSIDKLQPIYCRGGQDGQVADGKCQFTCAAGFEDCDGNPANGCEVAISDNSCSCVNCAVYLPGTKAKGLSGTDDFAVSQSTCDLTNPADVKCTVPCDATLCKDVDGDWENGCEVALAYPVPRNSTAIGQFDCAIWSKNLLLAKKQHIAVSKLSEIFCEGRADAPEPGTCSFQSACLSTETNGLHDYQDCNSDPRDGCEDTGRWCQIGQSATANARGTRSDRCSKAQKYLCDVEGFNALDQLCTDLSTGFTLDYPAVVSPSFDCYVLFATPALYKINTATVIPYCDRDATNLETRGDCVFQCMTNYSNCDSDASNGCEARVDSINHCDYDCIDCRTLSGRDQTGGAPGCIADTVNLGRFKCDFNCTFGICEDVDGNWKNGCERAMNGDRDEIGVFMNIGDDMDCSVMQEEVYRNPEFFVHHLHIDVTSKITTTIATLPGGTIFCNNGLVLDSVTPIGHCHFECVFGFANENGFSYDGCEDPHPTNVYAYTYGGYWIGNFHDEEYIDFLCDIENGALVNNGLIVKLKVPAHVCDSDTRNSGGFFGTIPVVWY